MREVADPREVGSPGDSVLLTPDESAPLLCPLQVTPALVRGALPETLTLALHWWKDEHPPPVTLSAGGRRVTETWQCGDEGYCLELSTAAFQFLSPAVPMVIEIRCGPLQVECPIVPAGVPAAVKINLPSRTRYRMENDWYALEVSVSPGIGALASLEEQARAVEHFPLPANRIDWSFENAGQLDRYATGWKSSKRMREAVADVAGVQQESAGARLFIEGTVDEERRLRAALTCLLYDHLPLLSWQRTFRRQPGKASEKHDTRSAVTVPIDDLQAFAPGIRTAWMADAGSRILCACDDHLVIYRPTQVNDSLHAQGWWVADGWVLIEHPARQQCTLYLFDPVNPPLLASRRQAGAITFEPWWPMAPMHAGDVAAFSLALSAGECCGADSLRGAWLACRKVDDVFGVTCAVVARLRGLSPEETARLTLGNTVREVPLHECALPGIGQLHFAVVEFPNGRVDDPLHVEVAGIPSRREGIK